MKKNSIRDGVKRGNSIKYLIKEGFRNVWVNRFMSIASVGVLMSCLLLLGCTALVLYNVNGVLGQVENQNVIMMYIEDGQLESDIKRIGEEIEKVSNIESCVFVSKEEALQTQLEDIADGYAEFFKGLEDDNPLPDAYRIVLKDISLHDNTMLELNKIEGIESISDRSDIAYQLTSLKNVLYVLSFWVVGLLLFVALFIIANTIKLTMYNRRLEISIMKAVGATDEFIRVPFVVEGMTLGLISAVIAYVAMYYIYIAAQKALMGIPFLENSVPFGGVALVLMAVFIVIGVGSGAVGSVISISRYLKREGSEINGV